MQKIQTYSHRIRLILQFLMVLLPIMNLCFWLSVQSENDFLVSMGIIQLGYDIASFTQEPLTMSTRLWAFLASMLPCGILVYALGILVKLFKSYEKAEVFTVNTAKYFQKLGFVFFYWAIGSFVYSGLISVELSFNNPPSERMLALSFVGLDAMSILCGFIVLTIAWVMKEAQQITDEHQHTI
ncbi:Protein of unknown function (DUF2975) [Shewanella psychrophila]|uniref:DUF2975 domain-containing protein n=1 Tax=Shewanella psychrophila TaxID=225848 RepID=A0A1S6HLL1_9GAMM|nr:DUF2975 domain-containing protein [Shewanella psychrophila]AQS36415.1 Protein of unknown function (DUF2975) [Shewanella psychrophila]